VVTAVSQNARLDRIDQLQAEIVEGHARIRQRQEQRAADPCLEQDWLMGDAPSRLEGQGGAPVQREGPAGDLVYRRTEDALQPAAGAMDAANAEGWNRWVKAHLANERAEIIELLIQALGEFGVEFTREKVAPLEAKIADLRRTLQERDERTKAIAEIKREVAGERVEREALQLSAALAVRDAKIEKLETQIRMLCSFLSVSGVDLPKGL
jgi:hypothetical protein